MENGHGRGMAFHFSRNSRASPICKGWRFAFGETRRQAPFKWFVERHADVKEKIVQKKKKKTGVSMLSRERSLSVTTGAGYDLLFSNDRPIGTARILLIFRAETCGRTCGCRRIACYILTRVEFSR